MRGNTLDALGQTGLIPAAVRAIEHLRADRLFTDPYAAHFCGARGMVLMSELSDLYRAVGIDWITDYFAARIRFYDDVLADAVARGIRQVVLPAASMDCRAFRLPWPAGTRMFEIDRAAILDAKEEVLSGLGARPRAERIRVVADLTGDWEDPLLAAGYRPDERSVWVFEGLLCYLSPDQVAELLGRIHAMSAPGSVLGADVHNAADLNSGYPAVLDWFATMGAPFRSADEHPERLWAQAGYTAHASIAGQADADYGRLPALTGGQVLSYFMSGVRKPAA